MNNTYSIKRCLLVAWLCFLLLPCALQAQDQTVNNGQATAPITFPAGCNFNWTVDRSDVGLTVTHGTGNIPSFTAANNTASDITATITAIPSYPQYAYVGNPIESKLWAVDVTTGTASAPLTLSGNAFGVAVSPDGTRIYTTSNNSGKVTVINAQTFTAITEIQIGTNLAAVVVSPDGTKVYVVDNTIGTGHLAVIDTQNGYAVTNVNVGPRPFGIALNADGSRAYVTYSGTPGGISIVNTADPHYTVTRMADIGMSNASGIALSTDQMRLYVLTPNNDINASKITVYNMSNPDNPVKFFTTTYQNGEQPYSVSPGPGNTMMICMANKNQVWVVPATNGLGPRIIMTGNYPVYAAPDQTGEKIYIATSGSNELTVAKVVGISYQVSKITLTSSTLAYGNFVGLPSACNSTTITYTIKIKATPQAPPSFTAVGNSIPPLNTIYGQPTPRPGEILVSGQALTAPIAVSAPPGFEVSSNGVDYGPTATLGTTGAVSGTVYVRLSKTTPVGNNYSGNVVFSSQNTGSVDIAIPVSTVSKAPLNIKPDDKTRVFGTSNPVFTATYSGFVNNEDISQLTTKPTFSTPADINTPPGTYPISGMGAVAANYSFNYFTGMLTIVAAALEPVIPNTFTPNGDGINDTWKIQNTELYSNFSVKVYNRNGQNVFSAANYNIPWNGTYSGQAVPVGTYYYLITINNGEKVLSGNVTIIR